MISPDSDCAPVDCGHNSQRSCNQADHEYHLQPDFRSGISHRKPAESRGMAKRIPPAIHQAITEKSIPGSENIKPVSSANITGNISNPGIRLQAMKIRRSAGDNLSSVDLAARTQKQI